MNRSLYIFLLLFSTLRAFSQQSEFDSGNVQIINPLFKKIILGFEKHLQHEKISNSTDFIIAISSSKQNKKETYFEIRLFNIAMIKKDANFYAYGVKNNFYYIFWNASNYISKKNIPNPTIFSNQPASKLPTPPYDPSGWEVILTKKAIVKLSPAEAIDYLND